MKKKEESDFSKLTFSLLTGEIDKASSLLIRLLDYQHPKENNFS